MRLLISPGALFVALSVTNASSYADAFIPRSFYSTSFVRHHATTDVHPDWIGMRPHDTSAVGINGDAAGDGGAAAADASVLAAKRRRVMVAAAVASVSGGATDIEASSGEVGRRKGGTAVLERPATKDDTSTCTAPIDDALVAPHIAILAKEMQNRAESGSPLLDSELDDAIRSLRNVSSPSSSSSSSSSSSLKQRNDAGEIDWDALRSLLSEAAHLSHKSWERTARSASELGKILLPHKEENGDADVSCSGGGGGGGSQGLTDNFRRMFQRVLEEGNWDGAASYAAAEAAKKADIATQQEVEHRPWAVLVTGVNGIRKTTSVYQPWFEQILAEALVPPSVVTADDMLEQSSSSSSSSQSPSSSTAAMTLPTGDNSFFRQLDHMIATLANEDFRRLYVHTDEFLRHTAKYDDNDNENNNNKEDQRKTPSAQTISLYSKFKAAIFARYRTLSEILGILLVRQARRVGSNVMIETSGRDAAMFHYVDVNFPPEEKYRKLALRFTINDIAHAEQSVDRRMIGEIQAGINAIQSTKATTGNTCSSDDDNSDGNDQVRRLIRVNAGGPYGSEVLKGVQADSDCVWNDVVMKGKVGQDWYKATIEIHAHPTEPWTARAVRPDGTKGKVYTFEPPRQQTRQGKK